MTKGGSTQRFMKSDPENKILIEQDLKREKGAPEIQEEIRRYIRLLPEVAEPNLARVRELKEEIQQGTYLTREMIEETASRLALRFLRKE